MSEIDVPAVRAAMVYVLSVRTSVMLYSWFNTPAVMLPPKLAAPLNVTKSPDTAPCAVSVTVIVADPLLAAKVTSPALVVERMGVMSEKLPPSWFR